MKKKIKIEKDKNGITWRKIYTKSAKQGSCIESEKIGGFRRKIKTLDTYLMESTI